MSPRPRRLPGSAAGSAGPVPSWGQCHWAPVAPRLVWGCRVCAWCDRCRVPLWRGCGWCLGTTLLPVGWGLQMGTPLCPCPLAEPPLAPACGRSSCPASPAAPAPILSPALVALPARVPPPVFIDSDGLQPCPPRPLCPRRVPRTPVAPLRAANWGLGLLWDPSRCHLSWVTPAGTQDLGDTWCHSTSAGGSPMSQHQLVRATGRPQPGGQQGPPPVCHSPAPNSYRDLGVPTGTLGCLWAMGAAGA